MASPGRDDAITDASGQPGSWQGLPGDLRWERTGGAGGAPGKGFGAQGCNIPPHTTGPRLESTLVPGEAPTCSRGRKTWHQLNQAPSASCLVFLQIYCCSLHSVTAEQRHNKET